MQKFAALSVAALVAFGVSAQSSVCPTESIATVTGTVTETYCPSCGLTTPAPLPTAGGVTIINNNDVEINIYVFPAIGSEGWYESTYTVTEECPCTANHASNYIPQGFTTSVTVCDVGGTVTTATVTCPEATETHASTTWTTVWESPCATGLAEVTYTITEECPCQETIASNYVPSGFTTSAYTCTTGATPVVTTVTVPASTVTGVTYSNGTAKASTAKASTAVTGVSTGYTTYTSAGTVVTAAVAVGGSAATVSTATVGTAGSSSSTSTSTIATWTGAAAHQTSNMGIALFTVAALTLAAAIGF